MVYNLILILNVFILATVDTSSIFPNMEKNLTKITWAHAVNNQSHLNSALNSDVNMLEADVSLGKLSASDETEIPIMAHPPANLSDLSLEQFLLQVNIYNQNHTSSHKGVKLDFKSIEAFDKSISVMKRNLQDLEPVWLNADILAGPVNTTTEPVNAERFLTECMNHFGDITLSIGWTTYFDTSLAGEKYTDQQIKEMISIINSLNVKNPITFPVRAGIVAESLDQMKFLLNSVPNSTLTIWSSESDPVNVDHLRNLILNISVNKIYIDVPKFLRDELNLSSSGNVISNINIFSVFLSTFILLFSQIL